METIEKEISYSINLSQDLLYLILDSYISKKFDFVGKYYDFVDTNNVRTRLGDNGAVSCQTKNVQNMEKFVFADRNVIIPFVTRISNEIEVNIENIKPELDKIVECRVYTTKKYPKIEIKFEQIYFNRNLSDRFDSLMASKQIALLNLLQNRNESIVKQSYLGSDEILANLRIEYEYDDGPNMETINAIAEIVREMDAISHYQNISPLIPYTTLQNNIIYRKFEGEKLIYNLEDLTNVKKWALKLDGIRGKGFFTRNFCIIFMDDMQLFAGHFPTLFEINNVVAFQCELIDDKLYITDLLHVFKYTYNNKSQYECSHDGYNIDPITAINTINFLNGKYSNTSLHIENCHQNKLEIKFQKFYDPPLPTSLGYTTIATDGFVVLDITLRYVKYKHVKTIELEYNGKENCFATLEKLLTNYKINSNIELIHNNIYETVIVDNVITVIKFRPDRLVPQMIHDETKMES
ncbi:lef-4 [Cryptophlebia peltastica nucleopolyhedrovirus]|uniref:Lef-4 n=1 Tax=Cryptophlebia peltastica nucleopolyhedrovirus TaxID=2304025 RepID=A0A346RNT8_9ABAC|nr:lef-4 [Cryptophlebia peltastica nucleopolyhedrovirus]AXS67735.1 lef-4 [Cryptophlebia peltastica nucleopolyhedrovirus]